MASEADVIYEAQGRGIFQRFGGRDRVELAIQEKQRAIIPVLLFVVGVPLAIGLVSGDDSDARYIAIGLLGTVVVLLGTIAAYRRFLKVRITEETLSVSRLGITKTIERRDIARVVTVMSEEMSGNYETAEDRVVLIIGKTLRTLCKFEQRVWGPEVLKEIAKHLGGSKGNGSSPRTIAELRKIYPGSYSWARAHIGFTTLIVICPIMVGLLIADALF